MNKAQEIVKNSTNATTAMELANAVCSEAKREQDWDAGVTFYNFEDGSKLSVSGSEYSASYWVCEVRHSHGSEWMSASGDIHSTYELAEEEVEFMDDHQRNSDEPCVFVYRVALRGIL